MVVANASPTIVSASGPSSPAEGAGGTFSAVVSDPGSLDTHTYAWTFGDGASSTLPAPNHTYLEDGVFNASLVVTDSAPMRSP